jgi:hypothetical protein
MFVRKALDVGFGAALFTWVAVFGSLAMPSIAFAEKIQNAFCKAAVGGCPANPTCACVAAAGLGFCAAATAGNCSTTPKCVGPSAPGVIPCSCSAFSC